MAADGSSTQNYVAFIPNYDGKLIIAVHNQGGNGTKYTCIYENGTSINFTLIDKNGNTTDCEGKVDLATQMGANFSGGIMIDVVAGSTYTISVVGSKGHWCGVIYDYEIPTNVATAPTFDQDGGDIMALTTINLTSDGAVYYQWSDEATAPETGTEDWTAGTSVTVPYEVGTKYLHAYATNGEGLESDVITKEFNITEIVLEAVTTKTWDFTAWPAIANSEMPAILYNENLIAYGGNSVAFNSNGYFTGGSASNATQRNITIKVAPKTRISVTCASSKESEERTLKIDRDAYGTTIATIPATSSTTGKVDHIGSDEATLINVSSTNCNK